MDTLKKYRNDPLLEVEMVCEGDSRAVHPLNGDVPVDGYVHLLFRDPDDPQSGRNRDGRWYAGSFPFRSVERDEYAWSAFPDKGEWKKHPVWKWKNPDVENPQENITLGPSIGVNDSDGDGMRLHCYIREGEIEWL